MGLHDGHRSRMKAEFLKGGLDHMPPHRVMELLLFYSIPQGDTNELPLPMRPVRLINRCEEAA